MLDFCVMIWNQRSFWSFLQTRNSTSPNTNCPQQIGICRLTAGYVAWSKYSLSKRRSEARSNCCHPLLVTFEKKNRGEYTSPRCWSQKNPKHNLHHCRSQNWEIKRNKWTVWKSLIVWCSKYSGQHPTHNSHTGLSQSICFGLPLTGLLETALLHWDGGSGKVSSPSSNVILFLTRLFLGKELG